MVNVIFAIGHIDNTIMAKRKNTSKKTQSKVSKKTPTKRKKNGQFDFGNDGRGKIWNDPDELVAYIEQYITKCDTHQKAELFFGKIKWVPDPIPYTIEGLAHHLGIHRTTLINYQSRKGYEPFFAIIKEFKEMVLRNLAERALMGNTHASFTMFLLKNNYGFVDKKEIEHTGDVIQVNKPQRPQIDK